jgi:quercetin dioxygenase-like cupin family protein
MTSEHPDAGGAGVDLQELARDHAARAAQSSAGRSAHTVHGGAGATLRQTVIALRAGQELAEHENPGEATVLVLEGRVRLTGAATGASEGPRHTLLTVPDERHALTALEDSVVLLTVAKKAAQEGPS